jgi:hypothetical protein
MRERRVAGTEFVAKTSVGVGEYPGGALGFPSEGPDAVFGVNPREPLELVAQVLGEAGIRPCNQLGSAQQDNALGPIASSKALPACEYASAVLRRQ